MEDRTILDRELDGLIEAVQLAQDERALTQTLRNFSLALGFSRFAYITVHGLEVTGLSNYPGEWQTRYLVNNYSTLDPVVGTAKRSMHVFTWSREEMAGGSPEISRFFGEAAEFGIVSGLSIPIRAGFGRTAMLTRASDQPHVESVEVRDAMGAMTAVAFVHVHLNFLNSRRKNRTVDLTPREAHCLAWAAQGKTKAETAALLGIKEPTVRFYTESAFAKLGATNITQAVHIATQLGLI